MDYLEIFRGKKVFITGHTGFKGAWLALLLLQYGAEITGYSLEPIKDGAFEKTTLETKIHNHVIADILDKERLFAEIEKAQPDFVFHLAAQSMVRYGYDYPVETFEANMNGTLNMLEAMRTVHSAKVFVNITTDKCYENKNQNKPFKEIDRLGGDEPYGASKACSELITNAYAHSYLYKKMAVATARGGNVVGGGDFCENRLIPDCIRALSKNQPIIIRNPHHTRPWQHVLDVVSGYAKLASFMYNDKAYSGAWNFGPATTNTATVIEVVQKMLELWGSGSYEILNKDASEEKIFLSLDYTKAKEGLKFINQYNLAQTLEKTIAWYKYTGDMYDFSVEQIQDYVKINS